MTPTALEANELRRELAELQARFTALAAGLATPPDDMINGEVPTDQHCDLLGALEGCVHELQLAGDGLDTALARF